MCLFTHMSSPCPTASAPPFSAAPESIIAMDPLLTNASQRTCHPLVSSDPMPAVSHIPELGTHSHSSVTPPIRSCSQGINHPLQHLTIPSVHDKTCIVLPFTWASKGIDLSDGQGMPGL